MNGDELTKAVALAKAVKYDAGKPMYSLIPPLPLRELAKLYTFGSEKYAAYNWAKGFTYSRCVDALMRHLNLWQEGENLDEESQVHHMAAVAFYAFAILHFHFTKTGTDDRYVPNAKETY